jgi:hypothetical protein
MAIKHQRERFNRNCIASSRGSYVMHAHKKKLEENHTQSASFFAAVKKSVPVYYVKCFGSLIQVTPERAAMYSADMLVIK